MTRRDLDQRFARGIAWVGGLRLVMQVLSWSATLIVVRLISPTDYGVAGMAGVYISIATLLAESGIPGAVIALPRLDDEDVSQLHTLALVLGAVGCLLSLLLAWPLAAFFREPLLSPVVMAMSSMLVLNGARTVPRAIMQRELDYRATAVVESARTGVQTITVLGGALAGLGYWAFALGGIAGSLSATIAAFSIRRIVAARPVLSRLEVPLYYARNLLFGRLAWQTYTTGDFMVIGRTRGSQTLGHYTLAWNIASLPGEKLTNFLTIVSSSFFASLRGDRAAMRRYLLLLTEAISLMTFPVLAGVAFVAADAVQVLWGEQWRSAILPMRLLAIYAMLNAITTPLSQILTAFGQVVETRRNALYAVIVLLPGFYVASTTLGIAAVAACWLVLYPLLIARPFVLVRATLSLSVAEYLGAIRSAALVTGTMVAALLALRAGLTHTLDPATRLVIEIVSGAAVALTVLRATSWHRVRMVWHTVRGKVPNADAHVGAV